MVASAADRIDHNLEILTSFKQSIWFGLGPAKYAVTDVIDNQLLLWLTRNGTIGAALLLSGVLVLFIRLVRSARGNIMAWFGTWSMLSFLAVFSMTGSFLDNFRLFFLTIIFYAAMTDAIRKETGRSQVVARQGYRQTR